MGNSGLEILKIGAPAPPLSLYRMIACGSFSSDRPNAVTELALLKLWHSLNFVVVSVGIDIVSSTFPRHFIGTH
jgi:hypothetical protein